MAGYVFYGKASYVLSESANLRLKAIHHIGGSLTRLACFSNFWWGVKYLG